VTRHRVFIILIFLEDTINVHGESANVCYCRTYDCIVLVFVGLSHDWPRNKKNGQNLVVELDAWIDDAVDDVDDKVPENHPGSHEEKDELDDRKVS